MYGEASRRNFQKISGEGNSWGEVVHVNARPHFCYLIRFESFFVTCCLVCKMTKMSSAMKKERAQRKRDDKAEINRALAEAVKRKLFSEGRKPERGEVKAIMKRLEHGAIGGSPSCAARNYADAAKGSKRGEEPPKADDASTDLPEGVTGPSGGGRVERERERRIEEWRIAEENAERLAERLLVAEANVERLLGAKKGEEDGGKKVAEAKADRLTERLGAAEANVERLLEAKRGEEDVGKKVAEVNADRLKRNVLILEWSEKSGVSPELLSRISVFRKIRNLLGVRTFVIPVAF